MNHHILNRPVWNTLTTRHSQFAVGNTQAKKFLPTISPLASSKDESKESLSALADLIPQNGELVLLQVDPIILPYEIEAVKTATCIQFVLEKLNQPNKNVNEKIQQLTNQDIPAMVELATLTQPGPFEIGTINLGEFWGIKDEGKLVAMAGQRMKHEGFTEISGVCAHPDSRGKGYARILSAKVATHILERGETPYLHSYDTNTAAVKLYESLGFRARCSINVAMIKRR